MVRHSADKFANADIPKNLRAHGPAHFDNYQPGARNRTQSYIHNASTFLATTFTGLDHGKRLAYLTMVAAITSNSAMLSHPLAFNTVKAKDFVTPTTYTEAVRSAQRDEWDTAMKAEWESLLLNNTFEIIDQLPKGRKAIGEQMGLPRQVKVGWLGGQVQSEIYCKGLFAKRGH